MGVSKAITSNPLPPLMALLFASQRTQVPQTPHYPQKIVFLPPPCLPVSFKKTPLVLLSQDLQDELM